MAIQFWPEDLPHALVVEGERAALALDEFLPLANHIHLDAEIVVDLVSVIILGACVEGAPVTLDDGHASK